MEKKTIQIPSDAAGERMDQWIAGHTDFSRSAFKQLVSDGKVSFNQCLLKKAGQKVPDSGGVIELHLEVKGIEPIPFDLDIVYEDEYLLVVNKPRHMLVYPVKDVGETTLVNGLLAHSPLSNYCGEDRPGLVHRIDRDTSGLVLVAKTNAVHEKLYQMLEKHEIVREYIGIVVKPFNIKAGIIDARIAHDYAQKTKRKVVPTGGQEAITHYVCVYQNNDYAIMRFRLETGRTHQIRVHMASMGHPLVGDGLYGDSKNIFGFKGQALHAVRLEFIHPITAERIVAVGKAPAEFKSAVKRIQLMS